MDDIVLVTVDSVRRDYADPLETLSERPVHTGITGSHYIHSSLTGLVSASYRAAITIEVTFSTIAEVFSDAGYTCLGYTPPPTTGARFGFDRGFDHFDVFAESGNRGSKLRQRLGLIEPSRESTTRLTSHRPKAITGGAAAK